MHVLLNFFGHPDLSRIPKSIRIRFCVGEGVGEIFWLPVKTGLQKASNGGAASVDDHCCCNSSTGRDSSHDPESAEETQRHVGALCQLCVARTQSDSGGLLGMLLLLQGIG